MGLAASQGRLLLLTARKNDLEFRAQQISQRRINLSRQLEDISTAYADATSNRQMKIAVTLNTNGEDANTEVINKSINLTYAALVSGTTSGAFAGVNSGLKASDGELDYKCTSAYRLVTADGAVVVPSADSIYCVDENGNAAYERNDVSLGADTLVHIKDGDTESKFLIDPALANGSTDASGSTDGPNYLQECIRNGKYLIQKGTATGDTANPVKWSSLSWDSTTTITDTYYTEDDDKAEAEYNRKQQEIQNQDKKLELELDNIETERSEVKTEEESVSKVIDENIEDTCNVFA